MTIVTGYKGEAHITPNDDQGRNQGTFGTGSYVLDVGSKFTPTLITANEMQIADGEGVHQGVHFRTLPGTYDTVTIENGSQGFNRKDLVVCRYTKDSVSGVEDCSWVVIKGTASSGTATRPSHTTGDILGGSTTVDMPMFEIVLSGINVTAVNTLFSTLKPMKHLFDSINTIKSGSGSSSVTISANSYVEQTYSYDMTFSAAPHVFLTLTGTGDNGYRGSVSAFVVTTTTTAVTVRFYNNSAASLSVGLNWLAIGL